MSRTRHTAEVEAIVRRRARVLLARFPSGSPYKRRSSSHSMYDLVTRTISQALQAFLPIAFCLTWLRRAGAADPVKGLRWGLIAALPATAAAAYWFQTASRQAQWEAALAAAAL